MGVETEKEKTDRQLEELLSELRVFFVSDILLGTFGQPSQPPSARP